MKPEIEIWIDRAETTWLDVLFANAQRLFQNTGLPSHDHMHHLRVWNLCKTLLREITRFNTLVDEPLVEGVLIAALFHDLGMVHSTREDHGRLGSGLCISWFRESGRDQPFNFEEILRAIELHDRKNDLIYGTFGTETAPDILGILSVADDLEALGIIGIYRYAEIYLRRGIPLEDLGRRILQNAGIRYERLSVACHRCRNLLNEFRLEYDELCAFFEEYNLQITSLSKLEAVHSGPLGVINYLRVHGPDPKELSRVRSEVYDFFLKLDYELDQVRL